MSAVLIPCWTFLTGHDNFLQYCNLGNNSCNADLLLSIMVIYVPNIDTLKKEHKRKLSEIQFFKILQPISVPGKLLWIHTLQEELYPREPVL